MVGEISGKLGLASTLFFATKVWTTGRRAGIEQMEASQRALGAPRLDLEQVHNLVDVATHLPTLRAWKDAGKIRYVGISHYDASAYEEVESVLRREKLDFLQINYSVAEPESGAAPDPARRRARRRRHRQPAFRRRRSAAEGLRPAAARNARRPSAAAPGRRSSSNGSWRTRP